MEKPPIKKEAAESQEEVRNPNSVFEWGMMPKNNDVPVSSRNVYRQVRSEAVDDLMSSGVVRNAGSAGGQVRKYGDRVYWTRGKDGEFHNIQPDHVVLEAPYSVAISRIVTADDLVGIHARNESGEVENRISSVAQVPDTHPEKLREDTQKLADVRSRLGLTPGE